MVTVGTRITPRPPHGSRRALLTHRGPPSGRTSVARGLKPHAFRRTAVNRIDVVTRLSVRTTAACRLFPSGEALPSTTSAGSCLPLFGRFLGTTTSSDFSSAYMLGVRLLPSRAGPAQVRARVRPPRFRAKNFSTCTRSTTARGSSHASRYAMGRCCLLYSSTKSAPRNSTRFAAQYSARGLPCERFTAALAGRTSCITRGRGGWLDLPRGGLAPPILCQLFLAHAASGQSGGTG